jgi:hypothetical protein
VGARADRRADLVAQRLADAFVGVERKHPVALGEGEATRHLRPVARPIGANDSRAGLLGERRRGVAAVRIEHQHFVGERRTGHTFADVSRFVFRNDDDRQRVLLRHGVVMGERLGRVAPL